MTARLLAGAPVAEAVLADVADRVRKLAIDGKRVGLGTIVVGDDPASLGYVRKKHEACEQVGMDSYHIDVPADGGQEALLAAVDRFNADPAVDGYLIQHPVPEGFDFAEALERIDPAKDSDGLHPVSLGKLVLQEPGAVPCTPAGIQALFVHYGIDVAGKNVVVVGRGPTLGRPLALLLTLKQPGANAAVTVVHTGVPNLADYTRAADIVTGLRILRGVGGEATFSGRYRTQSQQVRSAGVRVARVESLLEAAQVLLPGLFVVLGIATWWRRR